MVDLQRVQARVAEAKIKAAHEEKLADIARVAEEAKQEAQRATVFATVEQLGLSGYRVEVETNPGIGHWCVSYNPIEEYRVHYHAADYDLAYEYALKSLALLAEDEDKLVYLFLDGMVGYKFEVLGARLGVTIEKARPRKTGEPF
jgi:hypothetical protein